MTTVDLPIQTAHGTAFQVLFPARSRALRQMTRLDGLTVVEVVPGWSMVAVSVLHHVEADPEPHYELSLAWPVRYRPALAVPLVPLLLGPTVKDAGWWIHRSVVSSRSALTLGRQGWGFPREMGRFRVSRVGSEVTTEVSDSLGVMLRLRASVDRPMKSMVRRVAVMSRLEGQLLRTVVSAEAVGFDHWGRPRAAVDLWEHPRLAGLATGVVVSTRPVLSRAYRDFRMALWSARERYRLGSDVPQALAVGAGPTDRSRLTLVH